MRSENCGRSNAINTSCFFASFKLLTVLARDKVTLWERLWTPFSPTLWMSILATWVLVAFLYSLLGDNHDFLSKIDLDEGGDDGDGVMLSKSVIPKELSPSSLKAQISKLDDAEKELDKHASFSLKILKR